MMLEPAVRHPRDLRDSQLRDKTTESRQRLAGGEDRDTILAEAFALVREASRRALDRPHREVQLIAGLILDEGWVAEIAAGEGKTLVVYPPAYMAVLEQKHIHVVTGNETLANRDAAIASTVFELLGVSVGTLPDKNAERNTRRAYECDITYGSYIEFGFDGLRDRIGSFQESAIQGPLDFAIIDEVDHVVIDEGRTPLLIAGRGPTKGHAARGRTVWLGSLSSEAEAGLRNRCMR